VVRYADDYDSLTSRPTGITNSFDDSTVASNELGSGHKPEGNNGLEGRHFEYDNKIKKAIKE
jgi:hypothetical protein